MKKTKPKFELLLQPFNPERPDKFGMRMAVPVRPKPRKSRKGVPQKLTFSAGFTHLDACGSFTLLRHV